MQPRECRRWHCGTWGAAAAAAGDAAVVATVCSACDASALAGAARAARAALPSLRAATFAIRVATRVHFARVLCAVAVVSAATRHVASGIVLAPVCAPRQHRSHTQANRQNRLRNMQTTKHTVEPTTLLMVQRISTLQL